ncbi:MAG TPA: DUF2306 domain-containing protein [Rhizomicrobium sp.]|nr:DUF2306 domain-containing protein [Rhizomicrobium sp.]
MTPFPPPVHPFMPWVILHIAAGCLAILTGYTAVLAAKGGTLHRRAGTVFVGAMLTMASVAVYLAVSLLGQLPGQVPNVAAGSLAFYLVLSAWLTVKRPAGTVGAFERVSFLIPLTLSALFAFWGLKAQHGKHGFDGYAPVFFFVFGGISLFLAALDLRVLAKGGLEGTARIARHLWRMCFAFFFAAGSFFLGQQKVMPLWMHGSKVLLALGLAPLGFMLFWLVRARFRNTTLRRIR